MNRWKIHAPSSSANLGPGFDVLGLAVQLGITVQLTTGTSDGLSIEITGEGSDSLPRDRSHLMVRVASEIAGAAVDSSCWKIHSTIPMARGLGSSAAAHACGIAAGLILRDGSLAGDEELFQRLSDLEGHPDNAAACIGGGFQAGGRAAEGWQRSPLTLPGETRLLLLIPEVPLPTVEARAALPEEYSRSDVISNLASMATLISGLASGNWRDVQAGCSDRIHQRYRLPLIPGLSSALETLAATDGLHGAWLSGAGPTLAAFLPDRSRDEEIAEAAANQLAAAGTPCQVHIVEIDETGFQVEELQ